MGWSRGGGPRAAGAALVAAAAILTATCFAGTARAATPTPPTTPAPAATTTLPPLPNVAPQYTNGQPAQSLLTNAVALASLGLDDSALMSAVAATQAKLDADAVAARIADATLAAATQRAAAAQARLRAAQGEYTSMAGAVRQAVIYLYTTGPQSLTVSPGAGQAALYAQDYADSTIGPYGVLARRQVVERQRAKALKDVESETRAAAAASAHAAKALADQQAQLLTLKAELASASAASVAAVTADHTSLAGQAGNELLADSALQFAPKAPLPTPVSTTAIALTWAFAEIGKEYVWGATGPDTFDCSGLTQFVWKAAGVSIPRVAADQDAWTIPVPLSQLLPGDLVFFGTTDIHHVGIYIGGGLMINAPHTGTVVQVSPIWWSDLAGFGRVHYAGTPVPPHDTPSLGHPTTPAVLPAAGKVPSQTAPPLGWKPGPDTSSPIGLGVPTLGLDGTTTTVETTPTTSSTTSTTTTTTTLPDTSSTSTTTTTPLPATSDTTTSTSTSVPTTASTGSG